MKVPFLISMASLMLLISSCSQKGSEEVIMTVKGPLASSISGSWLTHEHILVDFTGADSIGKWIYSIDEVLQKALPALKQAKSHGVATFVDCTPAYLGRNPLILKLLSDSTGINFITNTGYYGAFDNKYIPGSAFSMSSEELSKIWIGEWENGIDGSGIKPGFIKIAVGLDSLSEFHRRLVRAAALAHISTGLSIGSHTGPALPAFQQIEILKQEGVSPDAFIWIHAQAEKDSTRLEEAARLGAWISLDDVSGDNIDLYIRKIKFLREKGLLNKILLSHDAGWFDPAIEGGGNFRGFNDIPEKLVPALRSLDFSDEEIRQMLEINPASAFGVKKRLNKQN
jgi:phosphotriesterase-related protein